MTKKYYYIATNKDMKCGDFQFKVGETYTTDSEENVFYFFEKLEDTIDYYWDSKDRHFLIEVFGDIEKWFGKLSSNKIKIVKEISREEIEEHIQKTNTYHGERFLAYYSCNIKTLGRFAHNSFWEIRKYVVQNSNVPVEMLEKLAKDEEWIVRREVARNSNTPAHILEELAKDKKYEVREVVAKNSNTPIYILEYLSKDESEFVCRAVAENPNTPVHILRNLSKDRYWSVRKAVVENPNTPAYILKSLLEDEKFYIRPIAEKRLKEIIQ